MNQVAEEMKDILMHYGTPRHSGRYPWGSGENPYQRNGDFSEMLPEYDVEMYTHKNRGSATQKLPKLWV